MPEEQTLKDDEYYMQEALQEAQLAYDLAEVPIGAVLVDNATGEIVTRGHNMREIWHDATAHAELIAIQKACKDLGRWRLSGLTLYVTIEPCPMCAGAIVMSRVDRVVYGSTDSRAGACESVFNIPGNEHLNHRPEITAVRQPLAMVVRPISFSSLSLAALARAAFFHAPIIAQTEE